MKPGRKKKTEEINQRIEVENKFETLCNNVTSTHAHWNQCLGNVLDLKNELLKHAIPPALVLKLTMSFSELYRSQADLVTPVQELVRLVNVFKGSLEDKSIALKRIDEENERRKKELNIAISKLEEKYALEKQWRKDRTLNNWEKLFCKSALKRTHGRRWKFVINKIRQRAHLGLSAFNPLVDTFSDEEEGGDLLAHRFTYGSTTISSPGLTTKRSGMTSRNTAFTSKQSTVTRNPRQSSLMSSSLNMNNSVDTDPEEETTSELDSPFVSFGKQTRSPSVSHKSRSPVPVKKIHTEDKCVSTQDPLYDKLLRIQVFQPIGLKLPVEDISCTFTLLGIRHDTDILDGSEDNNFDELRFMFEGEDYKELGCKRGTTLNDIIEEDISEILEITVHSGQDKKIFAISTIPIEDISDTSPTVDPVINPEDVVPKPFPMYALEGDVTAPCGYIPIFCVWELKERLKQLDKAVETDYVVIEDEEEEILLPKAASSTSPALSRKSVSVMIPTPKPPSQPPSPEPEYTSKKELADLALAHAEEIEKLQSQYESRLESMTKALEMLRTERTVIDRSTKTPQSLLDQEFSDTPLSLISCFTPASRPSSTMDPQVPITTVPSVSIKQRAVTTEPHVRRKRTKWGDDLPQDFFERMDYFAQTSSSRHQHLINRIRQEVKKQTENAMATQHRLSREVKSADSGITEDVSLPAIFMPNKTGVVFSPKARRYFHPPGSKEPRLTQPPSVFRLPNMGPVPVLNLFDLSQKNVVEKGPGWLYKTCRDVTKR